MRRNEKNVEYFHFIPNKQKIRFDLKRSNNIIRLKQIFEFDLPQ